MYTDVVGAVRCGHRRGAASQLISVQNGRLFLADRRTFGGHIPVRAARGLHKMHKKCAQGLNSFNGTFLLHSSLSLLGLGRKPELFASAIELYG